MAKKGSSPSRASKGHPTSTTTTTNQDTTTASLAEEYSPTEASLFPSITTIIEDESEGADVKASDKTSALLSTRKEKGTEPKKRENSRGKEVASSSRKSREKGKGGGQGTTVLTVPVSEIREATSLRPSSAKSSSHMTKSSSQERKHLRKGTTKIEPETKKKSTPKKGRDSRQKALSVPLEGSNSEKNEGGLTSSSSSSTTFTSTTTTTKGIQAGSFQKEKAGAMGEIAVEQTVETKMHHQERHQRSVRARLPSPKGAKGAEGSNTIVLPSTTSTTTSSSSKKRLSTGPKGTGSKGSVKTNPTRSSATDTSPPRSLSSDRTAGKGTQSGNTVALPSESTAPLPLDAYERGATEMGGRGASPIAKAEKAAEQTKTDHHRQKKSKDLEKQRQGTSKEKKPTTTVNAEEGNNLAAPSRRSTTTSTASPPKGKNVSSSAALSSSTSKKEEKKAGLKTAKTDGSNTRGGARSSSGAKRKGTPPKTPSTSKKKVSTSPSPPRSRSPAKTRRGTSKEKVQQEAKKEIGTPSAPPSTAFAEEFLGGGDDEETKEEKKVGVEGTKKERPALPLSSSRTSRKAQSSKTKPHPPAVPSSHSSLTATSSTEPHQSKKSLTRKGSRSKAIQAAKKSRSASKKTSSRGPRTKKRSTSKEKKKRPAGRTTVGKEEKQMREEGYLPPIPASSLPSAAATGTVGASTSSWTSSVAAVTSAPARREAEGKGRMEESSASSSSSITSGRMASTMESEAGRATTTPIKMDNEAVISFLPLRPSAAPLLHPPIEHLSPSSSSSSSTASTLSDAPRSFLPSSVFFGEGMENMFLCTICACKAAYAVPSIYFNPHSGRVEPNPYYHRHLAAKRIALQGVVPQVLRFSSSPSTLPLPAALDQRTPREGLLLLEKALLLLFTSLVASFPSIDPNSPTPMPAGASTRHHALHAVTTATTSRATIAGSSSSSSSLSPPSEMHASVVAVLEAQERVGSAVCCHREISAGLPWIAALQACLAQRTASPFQIATLGHILYGGGSSGRTSTTTIAGGGGGGLTFHTLTEYVAVLQQRIAIESTPMMMKSAYRRAPAEHYALEVTAQSVQDIAAALEAVQMGYAAVQVPTAPSSPSASSLSSSWCAASASLLCQGFYRLLRVVLQLSSLDGFLWRHAAGRMGVETEGGGAHTVLEDLLPPQLSSRVTQFDPATGRLTLTRASTSIPWGLELNQAGELVSVHYHTRHATAEGKRLFQSLQQYSCVPRMGSSLLPNGWYIVGVEEQKIPLARPPLPPSWLKEGEEGKSKSSKSGSAASSSSDTAPSEAKHAATLMEEWDEKMRARHGRLVTALRKASIPPPKDDQEGRSFSGRRSSKSAGRGKSTGKLSSSQPKAWLGKTLHLQLALPPRVAGASSAEGKKSATEATPLPAGSSLLLSFPPPRWMPLTPTLEMTAHTGAREVGCLALQGEEGRPSTRVLLLLERPSTAVSWGISLETPLPSSSLPTFSPSSFLPGAVGAPAMSSLWRHCTAGESPSRDLHENTAGNTSKKKKKGGEGNGGEVDLSMPAFSPRLLTLVSTIIPTTSKTSPSKKTSAASPPLLLSPATQAFLDRGRGEWWVRGFNGRPTVDHQNGLPHILHSSITFPGSFSSSAMTTTTSSAEAVARPTHSFFGGSTTLGGGAWRSSTATGSLPHRAALHELLSSSFVLALELEHVPVRLPGEGPRPPSSPSSGGSGGGDSSSSSPGSTPIPEEGGSGGSGLFRMLPSFPPPLSLSSSSSSVSRVATPVTLSTSSEEVGSLPSRTTTAAEVPKKGDVKEPKEKVPRIPRSSSSKTSSTTQTPPSPCSSSTIPKTTVATTFHDPSTTLVESTPSSAVSETSLGVEERSTLPTTTMTTASRSKKRTPSVKKKDKAPPSSTTMDVMAALAEDFTPEQLAAKELEEAKREALEAEAKARRIALLDSFDNMRTTPTTEEATATTGKKEKEKSTAAPKTIVAVLSAKKRIAAAAEAILNEHTVQKDKKDQKKAKQVEREKHARKTTEKKEEEVDMQKMTNSSNVEKIKDQKVGKKTLGTSPPTTLSEKRRTTSKGKEDERVEKEEKVEHPEEYLSSSAVAKEEGRTVVESQTNATTEKGEKPHRHQVTETETRDSSSSSTTATSPTSNPSGRVRLVDLVDAPSLSFDNRVVMKKFDGTVATFCRPSLDTPWNINLTMRGEDMLLTRLPPFPSSSGKGKPGAGGLVSHPFVRYLGITPDGALRVKVEEINGEDVTLMPKTQRQKLLQSLRSAVNVRFALRKLA